MVCVLQVVGKGLSALTEAQLATPLDKTLQCSTWGLRPLTQAQVLPLLCTMQPVSLMMMLCRLWCKAAPLQVLCCDSTCTHTTGCARCSQALNGKGMVNQ